MEYMKLQRPFRRSSAWMGASALERGAWVSLVCYCADEENAGRIVGARAWRPKHWSSTIGVEQSDVEAAIAAGLATWEGDDLAVGGYDLRGEQVYQERRSGAKDAGRASGISRRQASAERRGSTVNEAHAQPYGEAHAQPHAQPYASTVRLDESKRTVEAHGEAHGEAYGYPSVEPISISISNDQSSSSSCSELLTDDHPTPLSIETSDPIMDAVLAGGGMLVDPDSDADLRSVWRTATDRLTPDLIARVFAAGPRVLGHLVRFPGSFVETRSSLRADIERKAKDRRSTAEATQTTAATEKCRSEAANATTANVEAIEPFRRVVQFIEQADLATRAQLETDCAASSTARSTLERIVLRQQIRPTAMLLGVLCAASPTLASIAQPPVGATS